MFVGVQTINDIMQRTDTERILARQKRWRIEKAEILQARRKKRYENNKEQIAKSQRVYGLKEQGDLFATWNEIRNDRNEIKSTRLYSNNLLDFYN